MRGALHIHLVTLVFFLALSACGGTSTQTETPSQGATLSTPAMRYIQDGAPLGVLGSDGRVTLEGGEHVATVHENGQVVDHAGARIFALTSSGTVVFSSPAREPMFLEDGALEIEEGAILTVDEGGNFMLGEQIVGVFVEGFDRAYVRAAFLGWLSLQFATIPYRRSLATEARANLESLFARVGVYVGEHGRLPSSAPETPVGLPCGEPGAWPEGAPGGFHELGFTPEGDVLYTYALEVRGGELVLSARADLDCDGTFGRFELHGTLAGGELTREPLLRVTNELE